jgi:hypothetical protein
MSYRGRESVVEAIKVRESIEDIRVTVEAVRVLIEAV